MFRITCFLIFMSGILIGSDAPLAIWDFGKSDTDAVFYDENLSRKEVQKQFSPFNYAPELIAYFAYLKNNFHITAAVETGTWKAETTKCLAFLFDRVHTIELQESFFTEACQTLSEDSNVTVHFGNSSEVLPRILPDLSGSRTLFYLDAHWFSYWPLLDELQAIAETHKDNCIVVIDDIKVPERSDIYYDVYQETEECSYEYVKDMLSKIYSSYVYFYVIPKSIDSRAKLVIIPSEWLQSFCAADSRHLFSHDRTEEVLEFARRWLPEDPVILEAGSYNGYDSVLMARFWPKGRVFAFEPVDSLFLQTKQNTSLYPNIKCFQQALSDRNGKMRFYVSEMNGKVSASGSLLPPKEHITVYPEIVFPYSIETESVTLDDWAQQEGLDHVDFLWLDMQGFELPMLKKSKLALKASVIYTEVEFIEAYEGQYLYEDVCFWMESQGFELIAADFTEEQKQDLINGRRFWGNCLFVKKEKLETPKLGQNTS